MDRRALLILALVAAAACRGPAPDFVTARGVEVYLQGHGAFLSLAQADAMEGWFLGAVGEAGYGRELSEGCLALAEVRIVDSGYRCWADRPCAGEQLDRVLIVVDTGCPYTSAYVHEVAHWLQQCVKGGYDPDHQEETLWRVVRAQPWRCPGPAAAP